jgi:hypothetical protein
MDSRIHNLKFQLFNIFEQYFKDENYIQTTIKHLQDLQKELTRVKEGGKQRLFLAKSNISSVPASIKDLNTLTEIYLYSNRLTTLPHEIGKYYALTSKEVHVRDWSQLHYLADMNLFFINVCNFDFGGF